MATEYILLEVRVGNEHAGPGDAFRAWPFDLGTDANAIAVGKCPDKRGGVEIYDKKPN
jgi:hypothetical protein